MLWSLRFASARYDSGAGLELFVVTIVLLGGSRSSAAAALFAGVVLAVVMLGCLQTAMTRDLVSSQDQNIVIGGLLIASVIVPNGGDLGPAGPGAARREGRGPPARRRGCGGGGVMSTAR